MIGDDESVVPLVGLAARAELLEDVDLRNDIYVSIETRIVHP
jgi:hypothetical protein